MCGGRYGPDRCVDAADRWLSESLRLRTFQSRGAWSSSRPVVMGHDGPVSDFLVTYLDAIDERLLDYLDEDDELKRDAVQRLRFYTSALLDGSIHPMHVMEDWFDWYALVPAFVATYGSDELRELETGAEFLGAIDEGEEVILTKADLAYLKELEAWIDMYPEMRTAEE